MRTNPRDDRDTQMRLHVQTWGEEGQPTALLIHGLDLDSDTWWRFGPELAQRGFHVVAPDLRGHGRSPRASRYSPTDWANDIVDTFHGVQIDVAVGHSLGGLVLAIAAHALRPRRLLYLDPAWRITAAQDAAFRQQWLSWLAWARPDDMRDAVGPGWEARDLDLSWKGFQLTDPAVIPGLAACAGYDHSPECSPAPTLVLGADPSDFITAEHARDLVSRGITVECPTGTGHFWFREDYDAFCRRVYSWLDDTSAASRAY
jgi:pimeloyl-ACP methyl ester carboxylesterase